MLKYFLLPKTPYISTVIALLFKQTFYDDVKGFYSEI